MSLDGIAMRALAQDLKTKLSGGRIDKISQPSATTMTMGVRAGGHNHKCYATINPQSARVSLSRKSFESPQTPPQFCMVLRKHIQGAVIENIRQVDWERMIAFDLRGRNEDSPRLARGGAHRCRRHGVPARTAEKAAQNTRRERLWKIN